MNRSTQCAVMLFVLLSAATAAVAQNGVSNAGVGAAPPAGSMQLSSQNPFYGSVPLGAASTEAMSLSLSDALDRGLKQNLGILSGNDSVVASQGQLWLARAPLLPDISANVSENAAKVSLAEEGFEKIAKLFPGPGFPPVIGPFGFFDARVGVTQSVVDVSQLESERAAAGNEAAEKLSAQDLREVVVLVITNSYLGAIAARARVDTVQAQVQTAQALYVQATDQKNAGVAAGIDLLRAQVELQTQQQQLIAAQNDLSKQKLVLARMIGLPLGQPFTLSDSAPYEPSPAAILDDQLKAAYANRADFRSAQTRVESAHTELRAAAAEHLPTLSVHADYGAAGLNPAQSDGVFTAYGAVHIPIFSGNHSHGDALVAKSVLDHSQQQLDDLRAQIEQEIRAASLDLQSASDQVGVAHSNVDLAQQTLDQARDRFRSGVTDNIEVVEAQEAVARTNESYISSLFAYNLARVELARATGSAEQSVRQYWKGK